jgi:phosphoribosylanthranilate isomerase
MTTVPAAAKICGLSTAPSLAAALDGGAAYVGFVHFAKSPRHLPLGDLLGMAQRVPSRVGRVAVLVDPDDALIDRLAASGALSALQLHGSEDPARVAAVKQRSRLAVWKGLGVRTSADISAAKAFMGAADLLLFDAKPPTPAPGETALPGGNGLRFDWRLLDGLALPMPWALSGGLDPETVAEAVRATGARLVDVSSGVEDAPGLKSIAKIQAFLKAVRGA